MKLKIDDRIEEVLKSFKLPDPIGFGTTLAPIMITCDFKEGQWGVPSLLPYGPIQLNPTAKVFHYGQEIFEGMKAYRVSKKGPYLFRPLENFKRFNLSAKRMAMPYISEEIFMETIKILIDKVSPFIPDQSGDSLYIRPFMISTEDHLGIAPSKEFKFIVVASPSASYFQQAKPLSVFIEREYVRAVEGGTGQAKTGGNYASGLVSSIKAERLGYSQTLWLDAEKKEICEEMSGMNLFIVKNGNLVTPALTGTILEGITRSSLIRIARDHNIEVQERSLSLKELIQGIKDGQITEAFACGTAVILKSIASFGEEDGTVYKIQSKESEYNYQGKRVRGQIGAFLKEVLLNLQEGQLEDPYGWRVKVPSSVDTDHKIIKNYDQEASLNC
ncbi:MAG: branched chain amino acid aminotransferase [Halobacteriovoraceae bacterium]|nr:branched chain amino acid aminotransferase [Halobacteriovoraceae bacterium]